MSCSASCLANMYWRAIKRVVRLPRVTACPTDETDRLLEEITPKKSLWDLAKVKDDELAVEGVRGGVFVFDAERLKSYSTRLINTIKEMPVGIRRSVSTEGIPWIFCGRTRQLEGVADDVLIEHVVAMCMAMGLLKNVGIKGDAAPMMYVMVDDIAIQRKERLKDRNKRNGSICYGW